MARLQKYQRFCETFNNGPNDLFGTNVNKTFKFYL